MKYINNIFNEEINFRMSLCCKIQSNYTPKEISKSFKKDKNVKEYKTIKSRIEYLDKELRGIEIINNNYEIKILPDEIRLSIEQDFNTVYSELISYFKDTIMRLPNKDEFYVESIIIYSENENSNIDIDETKTSKSNKMFRHKYFDEDTKITGHFGQLDGMISISFSWENKNHSYDEVYEYLEHIIEKDILIVI